MSIDIVQIRRKTFEAEASQVTTLNINDVARWCDGLVHDDGEKEGNFSRQYIKVPVIKPQNLSQTEAHIGDWVVRQGRGFKVYKDGPLKGMFELRTGRPVGSDGSAPQHKKNKPSPQTGYLKGPDPSLMPKKRTEAPAEVGEAGKQIVNPEAAQAERMDAVQTPREDIPDKLTDMTLAGASAEKFDPIEAAGETAQAYRETEEGVEKPKPITLDELNAQPGDPRTQNDILRERAEGAVGSEPVLDTREIPDTDDERTPGEVFRGEG